MSPPVLDLGDPDVERFTDGQLTWIMENGIRFTGTPGWKSIVEDDEMRAMVRFLRHLPEEGSVGIPDVYKESVEEHHEMTLAGITPTWAALISTYRKAGKELRRRSVIGDRIGSAISRTGQRYRRGSSGQANKG